MTRESFGRLYRAYCDEIPDNESKYLRGLFESRFLNMPVCWYGYVEEKTDYHAVFLMDFGDPHDQPGVLVTLPQGPEDPQGFVVGNFCYFGGILTGFSSNMCQNHSEYSVTLESNIDATYPLNPIDQNFTFKQYVEYFGTLDSSPFQSKYEKYWKETPIDVIGRFQSGFDPEERFHRYHQSGEIQRYITENRRLEIIVVPYSRDGSLHTFNLIQIVPPRFPVPISMRGSI
ncbi:hypothetical protein BLNAU_14949 [Blattamonas nauphoetae]|uniref:Uncharacterized protein n=1 Tax=Blattamonas nauphoetae TaxID=2049346 RepID=A0ABQ9XFN2_9EUKA|nr:hypothetical protein BLNAU_14949 [Blattamonas nauphoetae]